jgi:hypothetical protein
MKTWFDLEWSLSGSPILGGEERVIWLDIETRKVDGCIVRWKTGLQSRR